MIRPIDTQILHPQTPELANRQQVNNQLPAVQQDQFANIIQKEIKTKKDTVQETHKTDKLKTNKDSESSKKEQAFKQSKERNPNNATKKHIRKNNLEHKIDVRI